MITFDAARAIILAAVSPVGTEMVSLNDAAGRVLACEVIAPWDLPSCDNSAMDGFAVRLADCTPGRPLIITSYLPAGSAPPPPLLPGHAVRIMTGAPIPPGADAVVPLEEALSEGNTVIPQGPIALQQHIRWQGEDIAAHSEVLPAGTILRPAEISLLAACNQSLVNVYRRPRVAIVSTGDELVELGQMPAPGEIINSNALALAAAIRETGAEPVLLGIARDNHDSHRQLLREGLKADLLITSAGVSAGDHDLVRDVLAELGVMQQFWKIAVKPGGPTAFGIYEGKPVFSLPGNPVSVLLTFESFVRPALLKMLGQSRVIPPSLKALLTEEIQKKPGKLNMLRVRVEQLQDGRLQVISAGNQHTGILRTMINADAIALLPAERDRFSAGEEVDIVMLRRDILNRER